MNFNKHSNIEGLHAFLSASKYHWVNYDEEKLTIAFTKFLASQKGTELHEFACKSIRLGIRLPNNKNTLNRYVNDSIGYKMTTEQPLYYSENCFGTADSISFRQNCLRIFDLKTGAAPASIHQLEIYAALFCLEYNVKPETIKIELRLYQSDEVIIDEPPAEEILYIMEKIITFDKQIDKMKMGE
jgi:hypothetical protein